MKLKITLFLTALPYLAVARRHRYRASPAFGRGRQGGGVTERTVVASPETLRQEK
jgi:hypothetical protein